MFVKLVVSNRLCKQTIFAFFYNTPSYVSLLVKQTTTTFVSEINRLIITNDYESLKEQPVGNNMRGRKGSSSAQSSTSLNETHGADANNESRPLTPMLTG